MLYEFVDRNNKHKGIFPELSKALDSADPRIKIAQRETD